MEECVLMEYLSGRLSREASLQVEEWVLLSDKNRRKLENIYMLMFVNDRIRAKNGVDVNRAYRDFLQRKKACGTGKRPARVSLRWRAASVAAVALLFLLSVTFVSLFLVDRNARPVMVETKLGERALVTLPDGSKVWLNACSHLTYRQSLLRRERDVMLSGEAYFDVTHNRLMPFVVSNHDSRIRVLGTRFNVRCNDDETYLSTTLMEGSVLFSDAHAGLSRQLSPGEELVFDKNSRQIEMKQRHRPEESTCWIRGRLLFEDAPLEEIALSLERHYNVEIRFGDEKIGHERFNADFETTDNIFQILSVLELTGKLRYEVNHREVTIFSL